MKDFLLSSNRFGKSGKLDFLIGGQWGSEGKGAAAAWMAERACVEYDAFTTNAGAQAGHTSIVNGEKVVVFHLPTYPVVEYKRGVDPKPIFVNAGAIIDPAVFLQEVEQHYEPRRVFVHPMAAVITPDCVAASHEPGSASERRSGVQKGVGHALAKKVMRTGTVAKDHPQLREFVSEPHTVRGWLDSGLRVLAEVPQGVSLSLSHSGFYPHVTSRDCSIAQALNDAGAHPHHYGATMMVLRTFPIRVGNIKVDGVEVGWSGECYPDQVELDWKTLGVEPELTTVSKRVRRVFDFSIRQTRESLAQVKPDALFISFCNYLKSRDDMVELIEYLFAAGWRFNPDNIVYQWGPTSASTGQYRELVEAMGWSK